MRKILLVVAAVMCMGGAFLLNFSMGPKLGLNVSSRPDIRPLRGVNVGSFYNYRINVTYYDSA